MVFIDHTVILALYRTGNSATVKECRRRLFTKKDRLIENIPPTLNALRQHTLRSMYQTIVWNKALELQQNLPDPSKYGWEKHEEWKPTWTTQPVASKVCLELVRCKCVKGCTARCSCLKTSFKMYTFMRMWRGLRRIKLRIRNLSQASLFDVLI